MKSFFIASALILSSSFASAGAMKEISMMTTESVLETLGFDESIVSIEQKFTTVAGYDVAIITMARGNYKVKGVVPTFKCVTVFKKNSDNWYDIVKTECETLK
ncbi:hypothetical protein [Bdellovibrio sp. HCB274]|uniref:hypothetical protein n=1 Tax=Bdellovibrio sp. HCB274 TaxID=3394361 RepID=UPI0039B416C8